MKKSKKMVLGFAVTLSLFILSAAVNGFSKNELKEDLAYLESKQKGTMNFFVTHGHCSTPFGGKVSDFNLYFPNQMDGSNPLEELELSFNIDPNSFKVCRGDEQNSKLKTPGLFIDDKNEMIHFKSTTVFTMGIDWYQVNGLLSIKGIEREVKFFLSGIRNPTDQLPKAMVLNGQIDLMNWGIDYDLLVNGKSDPVPTKWMYLNMKFAI